MARSDRKALIKKIEEKRKAKLITYITSDRENLYFLIAHDVVPIIHQHILALPADQRARIDLLIYSRGGASDVPWALVSMIREYTQNGSFGVLIPYRAHSAATVIALGADDIVMTKKAELGPIDATIAQGPYNPLDINKTQHLPVSVEDVTGYFALFEKFVGKRPEDPLHGFEQLTREVHPLALGAVSRLLEETKLVGLRLLSTRAKPFSKRTNREIITKLSSEVYSHNHAISRTEAVKYLGLKHVKTAEECKVDSEIWDLFSDYHQWFQLDEPFKAEEHLVENSLEEYTWDSLPPFGCVESLERLDCFRMSVKVKRLRNVPPNVTLNLQNVTFPPVTLPGLSPGINPAALQTLIQQTIQAVLQNAVQQAAQVAAQQLLATLPEKGFQRIHFASGWKEESNL